MLGIVKWYNEECRYGFIINKDIEKDIYFNYKSINILNKVLDSNQAVSFNLLETDKGPQAENIKKINRQEIEDKYILLEKLGQGGNAIVRSAWNKDGKNFVAIKLLITNKKKFKKKYSRFKSEIFIMENEASEGIIPIIDKNIPDNPSNTDKLWYVMPIAKSILDCTDELITIDSNVQCIKELAISLLPLHEKEIVHRDIKPSNLYKYKDKWCFGDFGLVDYPEKEDITDSRESVGPKLTMAPEMKRDAKNSSGMKADVYSLAKTLWILLTKRNQGFDGQYDEYDNSIKLRTYLKTEYLVDLNQLLTDSTSNIPELRPDLKGFILGLENWLDNNSDIEKRNYQEWNDINKKLFRSIIPSSTIWKILDDIINVLNIIGDTSNYNHAFTPDGGGLDFFNANKSIYENCLEINLGGFNKVLSPKRLMYESIDNDPNWSYFRLECNELTPSNVYDDNYYCHRSEESVTELNKGDFVEYYALMYGYYHDEPIPENSRNIIRVLRGTYVIFAKMSGYNGINSTYDGRHNTMDSDDFRKEVLKLKKINEYYFQNKEEIDKQILDTKIENKKQNEEKIKNEVKKRKEKLKLIEDKIKTSIFTSIKMANLENIDSKVMCLYGVEIYKENGLIN